MKNPNQLSVFLLIILSSLFSYGQPARSVTQQRPAIKEGQAKVPQPGSQTDNFVSGFNKIFDGMNVCSSSNLKNSVLQRQQIIKELPYSAEMIYNKYDRVNSFIKMDNSLLNCATGIIDSLDSLLKLKPPTITVHDTVIDTITKVNQQIVTKIITKTETVHDTVFVDRPINGNQKAEEECNQKIIYLAAASGSLLLVLLLLLIKFIREHKIFKQLYEKIYDKILDELADKLLVGLGIKEDDKLKDKIKKLVELNQSRKYGEIKLTEYFREVDLVLE